MIRSSIRQVYYDQEHIVKMQLQHYHFYLQHYQKSKTKCSHEVTVAFIFKCFYVLQFLERSLASFLVFRLWIPHPYVVHNCYSKNLVSRQKIKSKDLKILFLLERESPTMLLYSHVRDVHNISHIHWI